MAKPTPDYNYLFRVWDELSRSTETTLVAFCAREGLDPECTRKAFERRRKAEGRSGQKARRDGKARWESLRLEFLEGDWQTLADFARAKALNSATGYFSKMTRGWLDQRAEIEAKTKAENVAAIADSKSVAVIARLHSRILIALYQCLGDLEKNGPVRERLHRGIEGVKDNTDFLRGVSVAVDTLLKVLDPIKKIEAATATRALLQKVLDQGLDVTEASIQLEMMGVSIPETLRIMLSKQEPMEPEPPENETPSDDELERRWRDGLKRIEEQESEFLPERQKEIETIKKECQDCDSFLDVG